MALILDGLTFIPLLLTKQPSNFPVFTPKVHFWRFNLNLYSLIFLKNFLKYTSIYTPSTYTSTSLCIMSCNKVMAILWQVALAFLRPNGITVQQQIIYSVMKVVLVISLGAIFIWLKPKKPSMKDIKALLAVLSIKTSIWGRGKSSLGQALLKSLKSMHILTFPSFFGTGTTLAIHSTWCTGLMNPTFNCLVTFSLIFRSHLVLIRLNLCLTGTM